TASWVMPARRRRARIWLMPVPAAGSRARGGAGRSWLASLAGQVCPNIIERLGVLLRCPVELPALRGDRRERHDPQHMGVLPERLVRLDQVIARAGRRVELSAIVHPPRVVVGDEIQPI